MEKFLIIDGPAILHQAWYALPKLTDSQGRVVSAAYGFTRVIFKLLREIKPNYIVVAFDTPYPTFRHKIFKEYKATRIPLPQEFYDQIPLTKEILGALKIKFIEKPGFEADDLIGTMAKKAETRPNFTNLIVTGDLDALQLVTDKTRVYFLKQGFKGIKIYDEKEIKNRYGLTPQQLIDFKALRGDPSDNIPGILGVGEKTAKKILKEFGSIENLFKKIEENQNLAIPEKIKNLILENKEKIKNSKNLVTIDCEVSGLKDLENYQLKKPDLEKTKEIFKSLGFKSLLKQLEKKEGEQKTLF